MVCYAVRPGSQRRGCAVVPPERPGRSRSRRRGEPPVARPTAPGGSMKSSLAPLTLAALLSQAWTVDGCASAAMQGAPAPAVAPPQESQEQDEAPAGDGKAKHEGPRLEFGRAEVKVRNIEQGNAHTVIVRAESVGTAP